MLGTIGTIVPTSKRTYLFTWYSFIGIIVFCLIKFQLIQIKSRDHGENCGLFYFHS